MLSKVAEQKWLFLREALHEMFQKLFLLAISVLVIGYGLLGGTQLQAQEWQPLFDGKSLEGWERVGSETSKWEVVDGSICGSGDPSMLVCTVGPFKNFKYRAEIKISDGGNSGMYFRTTRKPGFLDGYEAQIDSTHRDPIRTGSLYGLCHVYEQLVKPDTWFNYEVEVREGKWGNREVTKIKVTVDGKQLYEYIDFEKRFPAGHFAFQQHDPGSRVTIRKVEVLPLEE
ncbi:MAG: DUF1080 domain-containing protein [Planctomycetota bacterium]